MLSNWLSLAVVIVVMPSGGDRFRTVASADLLKIREGSKTTCKQYVNSKIVVHPLVKRRKQPVKTKVKLLNLSQENS